ncbi:hypothetical protein EC988_009456, partial [Linderina pennispora]
GKFAVSAVAEYTEMLPAEAEAEAVDGAATASPATPSGWGVDSIVAELTQLLLTDRKTSKLINPALIVADQLIEQGALMSASPDV